jgi:hypothetical protein
MLTIQYGSTGTWFPYTIPSTLIKRKQNVLFLKIEFFLQLKFRASSKHASAIF